MTNSTSIQQVRDHGAAREHDVRVDMFSTRGFALAQRVAQAFAASDAVPAAFRSYNMKKVNGQEQWVENTAALGNCIVAIEVAQAVGMSVTAVMQNADPIEGKLRWSDRFVVAGINASRRFTPLRFDVKNLGPIEASYKEKTGWDNQAKKPVFTERSVKLDNLQSIAWALPYGFATPPGIYTLDQARAAGLPVIEGPPVSMRLAVEEGWYAKTGSKWQTELKHKMLMMRSGRYFGDIHAPDIVMGIGRTSDEVQDIVLDAVPDDRGSYTVPLDNLRQPPAPAEAPSAEHSASPENGATTSGDPQDDDLRAVEQGQGTNTGGNWQPSAEEAAEMERRIAEEAAADQQRASAPRGRGQRSMNLE